MFVIYYGCEAGLGHLDKGKKKPTRTTLLLDNNHIPVDGFAVKSLHVTPAVFTQKNCINLIIYYMTILHIGVNVEIALLWRQRENASAVWISPK